MHVRGMTVRDARFLAGELRGGGVTEFISSGATALMAEVPAWLAWPLEPMYPVVFFSILRVTIKGDAVARNKAICLAQGMLPDGTRPGQRAAKDWKRAVNQFAILSEDRSTQPAMAPAG